MFFGFSLTHLILFFVIALIFIGPKQLPEVARGLAKFLREMRGLSDDFTGAISRLGEETQTKKIEPVVTPAPTTPAEIPAESTPGLPLADSARFPLMHDAHGQTERDLAHFTEESSAEPPAECAVDHTVTTQRVRKNPGDQA